MKSVILDAITDQITPVMAIVDYVPVILFILTSVFLLKDLWKKMPLWNYIILAIGLGGVMIAGAGKAVWKTVCCFGINIEFLNNAFFPTQSISFLVAAVALLLYVFRSNKGESAYTKVSSMAPLLLACICIQVLGCLGLIVALVIMAKRFNLIPSMVLFIVAFVAMLAMGYLGAKFDDSDKMHWLAQCTNIVAQGTLFTGTHLMHVKGFKAKEAK